MKFKIGDKVMHGENTEVYTVISKQDNISDYIGYTTNDTGDESYREVEEYYGRGDEGLTFSEIQFPVDRDSFRYCIVINDGWNLAQKNIKSTEIARRMNKGKIIKEKDGWLTIQL